jgi:hypothetical protein
MRNAGARLALILTLAWCLGGCATEQMPRSDAASASPSITRTAVESFVTDLASAGLSVRVASSFTTAPLGGTGTLVCAGPEPIQLYEFASEAARSVAAARINPRDPSEIDNPAAGRMSEVDWIGQPHFWQRDQLIILSVGGSRELIASLTTILGQPFAEGPPGGAEPNLAGCPGA